MWKAAPSINIFKSLSTTSILTEVWPSEHCPAPWALYDWLSCSPLGVWFPGVVCLYRGFCLCHSWLALQRAVDTRDHDEHPTSRDRVSRLQILSICSTACVYENLHWESLCIFKSLSTEECIGAVLLLVACYWLLSHPKDPWLYLCDLVYTLYNL